MRAYLKHAFQRVQPTVDFCSLRLVREVSEKLKVRQGQAEPVEYSDDQGAMLTVAHRGGLGYAATSDLSEAGLRRALERAQHWAELTAGRGVTDFSHIPMPAGRGEYRAPVAEPWDSLPLPARLDLLREESARCQIDPRIVDWEASLWHIDSEQYYLASNGAEVAQQFSFLSPGLQVVANQGAETQRRSLGGPLGYSRQGGLEILRNIGFYGQGARLAEEALELLAAPNCPAGKMDLLLAPDQMMLQIHESIGHPLELDRILGDERNYAGTSFVTPEMFGTYQYGSPLLDVAYDPGVAGQFAGYAYDEEGLAAEKVYLIRRGLLLRPLGASVSAARGGLPGLANARASSWNRPPIDRMANLNIEPGQSSFREMVASVERGVFMRSNVSWSIDDSRNKFQFGCEWGRLIERGELKGVVKNPNYRGISATFWRNLKAVGDAATFEVLGVPYCGKGEPNQVIRVGHASPACLFADVEVFGGES